MQDKKMIIDLELMRGSGFVGGKERIREYITAHGEKGADVFLKKEYGIGGWACGTGYMVSYDGKGISIQGDSISIMLSWKAVAKRLCQLMGAVEEQLSLF